MTLRMLKPSTAYLRGGLPLLQHQSPEVKVQRLRGSGLQSLKKRVLARCGYLCECPRCASEYAIKLTWQTCELDHIVPLYRGGTNAIGNLRALHIDCHARITAEQAAERAITRRLWSDDPAYDATPARHTPPPREDDMPC